MKALLRLFNTGSMPNDFWTRYRNGKCKGYVVLASPTESAPFGPAHIKKEGALGLLVFESEQEAYEFASRDAGGRFKVIEMSYSEAESLKMKSGVDGIATVAQKPTA